MRLLKFVPENTNLRFIRWRNVALVISTLLVVTSIALTVTRGLNFGVDFAGGQMVRVTFQQPPSIDELRNRVNALGLGSATIQEFGAPTEVAIRMPLPPGAAEDEQAAADAAARVRATIVEAYPDARIDAVESVSGKVSTELYRAGAFALLFALLAISIYIWIRFEWQFGVGALAALFHDVALTFGFFAVTQLEFNLNVVAALLTVIGYSLNDTIVIYDRIRENLRKYRKMAIEPLLDLSINETLARTIMTSLSMIIALAILIVVGPDVIFGLTAAILFGVLIGTYSSVYIGAPILIWLKVGPHSFVPREPIPGERVPSRNEGF